MCVCVQAERKDESYAATVAQHNQQQFQPLLCLTLVLSYPFVLSPAVALDGDDEGKGSANGGDTGDQRKSHGLV